MLTLSGKGPVLAYMKNANNATTDGPGNGWFKISEAGLNDQSKKFPGDCNQHVSLTILLPSANLGCDGPSMVHVYLERLNC